MQRLSTAFLIIVLVIVVHQDGAAAYFFDFDIIDQIAEEAKNRAITIIDGPKYVAPPTSPAPSDETRKPARRPSSKPPNNPIPDKKPEYIEIPRVVYGQNLQNVQNLHNLQNVQNFPPLRNHYSKQLKIQQPNSVLKYHKLIPLQQQRNHYYAQQQSLVFAASTGMPVTIAKTPKVKLPVETINGIRSDFVRPPHLNTSTTSTTTTTTVATTTRQLRTKRIWPKRLLEKKNTTEDIFVKLNGTIEKRNVNSTDEDLHTSPSRRVHVYANVSATTTTKPSTTRGYRPVTRVPKKKTTTLSPETFTRFEPNDWVPIVPTHYPINKVRTFKQTPTHRRSDVYYDEPIDCPSPSERMLYLQSYGLLPLASSQIAHSDRSMKRVIHHGNGKRLLNPRVSSGYRRKPGSHSSRGIGDHRGDSSHLRPKFVTKVKHHHHHHHHRYIKTVKKPYKVEVPKPYPVPMPVPVKVEHKVPYPVPVKVPHPYPVKVVEKEYVPKPYPVIQQVQVKVPVEVEKKVPYPVKVEVPKPYPVAVHVEKRVPYPVPVRVLVPQPYPVETKVPYPVQVKEPVEVIKHVPVRVPVPQPYPVRVPHPVPYPVEKQVPFPVEVEKKVPVPYRVLVPERVEVEKRVPVYVPKPYPVEKRVPVPVKVPYPVRVPVGVPIFFHSSGDEHHPGAVEVGEGGLENGPYYSHYSYSVNGAPASSAQITAEHGNGNAVTEIPDYTVTIHGNTVTNDPPHTVTVHGNSGFPGFLSRSDIVEETTSQEDIQSESPSQSAAREMTESPEFEIHFEEIYNTTKLTQDPR